MYKKLCCFLKENKRYIFIFLFSFIIYEILQRSTGDPMGMYSFGHAIRIGEVPYRDFNLISTPIYPFFIAIGLFIYDNYIVFLIEQSILVTILFYLLFKLYDKKAWIVLLAMTITYFFGFLATYNFMCFFFIVLLLYLEKEYSENDLLIGIVIGLAILSKHTIGLFLIIPLIINYYKQIGKVIKRIFGIMIPCFMFFIYLIYNKALYAFINLSILGLFDFNSKNSHMNSKFFYLSFVLFLIMIFITIKNKKSRDKYIYTYYLLCGLMFSYPIYDLHHFSLFFNCFVIFVISYYEIININYYAKLSIFITCLYAFLFFLVIFTDEMVFYKGFHHYEFVLGRKTDYLYSKKVNAFLDLYKKENIIILSDYTQFYDIIRDRKINYYDVLLYGNHGYNGTKYMINKINNTHNVYIFVDMSAYNDTDKLSQFNKDIVKYVIDNYDKVDSKYCFDVYYKK